MDSLFVGLWKMDVDGVIEKTDVASIRQKGCPTTIPLIIKICGPIIDKFSKSEFKIQWQNQPILFVKQLVLHRYNLDDPSIWHDE